MLLSFYILWVIVLGGSSMDVKFLSDREKHIAYAVKRLGSHRNRDWSQEQMQDTKQDTKTWLWFGLAFFAS